MNYENYRRIFLNYHDAVLAARTNKTMLKLWQKSILRNMNQNNKNSRRQFSTAFIFTDRNSTVGRWKLAVIFKNRRQILSGNLCMEQGRKTIIY